MSHFSNGLTCLSIQTSLKTWPREGAGYIHTEVYAWMVCYFHLSFSINSFCPIHFLRPYVLQMMKIVIQKYAR